MDYGMEISAMLAWIERHIEEQTDFARMEQAMGYSYRHLRDIFKRGTGVSLSRYIAARKAAYAAFEMAITTKPIREIAYAYGFASNDSFCRAFRRETGSAPSAFRKGWYPEHNKPFELAFRSVGRKATILEMETDSRDAFIKLIVQELDADTKTLQECLFTLSDAQLMVGEGRAMGLDTFAGLAANAP